uniref:Coiled-coil domain containing 148 n=1 Tax=Homo sapiens TaxID=9606 RepID=F8WC92_HUMAN
MCAASASPDVKWNLK